MPVTITPKLEVELVPGSGTWTDISSRCREASVVRPPVGQRGPAAPTVLTATLNNAPDTTGFCPFTPDSPGSAYYPNIERNRLVRLTATVGATPYVRFLGWANAWAPELGTGGTAESTVTLTASCVLSKYAERRVRSVYGETILEAADHDYWPFDEPADTVTLRGISSDTVPAYDGRVIMPSRPPGSATLSEPDGGHLSDGQIEFTRGGDNAPAPVVLLQLRDGEILSGFMAAYRLSTDPAGLTDDIVAGYNAAGERLWRWCASLTAGSIVWTLFDDADVAKSFYDTNSPRDDAWHYWHIQFSATASQIFLYDKGQDLQGFGSFVWSYDPRQTKWIVVGGQMIPWRLGKQTNTLQGAVSSFLVQYASPILYQEFIVPSVTSDASRVHLFLNGEGTDIDASVGGASTPGSGTDLRQVMYTNATRTLLDRWNEHVTTVSGILSTRPDGHRRYVTAETARPVTVSLTLDVEDDLDMPSGGWQARKEERPTRVTATGPAGTATVVDDDAETLLGGLRIEGSSVSTSGGDQAVLKSAAAAAFGSSGARLASFSVDAGLTLTDKTAALMTLLPGDRIRVDGLPPGYLGLTYQDVYASGWTETYAGDLRRAVFTFDTDPADDPPEARFDDATYARFAIGTGAATVTGGTCIGTTGTGTVIITTSSPLTTTGGEYPMNLNWHGEWITVSGVGGGTSPQTATVTARGVGPTVARAHATGQPIEIALAATFAL